MAESVRRWLGIVVMLAAGVVVLAGITAGPDTGSDRAESLASIIRCPQCQGESIADSSALTARTMRTIVEEKIAAGETDEEILDFVRNTYGDEYIVQPSFGGANLLLWAIPALVLAGGIGGMLWLKREAHA